MTNPTPSAAEPRDAVTHCVNPNARVNPRDAAIAYNEAAVNHFGESAILNELQTEEAELNHG